MAETVTKKPKTASKPRKTAPKKTISKVESIAKTHSNSPSHDQIADLARKYWADRGYKDGHHEDDWYRAEQELRGKAS
jgi:Protein of unknown function (DUF2934)